MRISWSTARPNGERCGVRRQERWRCRRDTGTLTRPETKRGAWRASGVQDAADLAFA